MATGLFLLSVFLLPVCLYDYSFGRIPNLLCALIAGSGVICTFCLSGWSGLGASFLRMVMLGVVGYLFFAVGMIGAGDVKLICAVSLFLEGSRLLSFLLFSMVTAGVIALGRLVWSMAKNRGRGGIEKRSGCAVDESDAMGIGCDGGGMDRNEGDGYGEGRPETLKRYVRSILRTRVIRPYPGGIAKGIVLSGPILLGVWITYWGFG